MIVMKKMTRFLLLAMVPGLLLPASPVWADGNKITAGNPALLTDVGQGNNAMLIRAMLRRGNVIEFEMNELAGVDKLAGKKSLIIGVGASTKGLGAAGLDVAQEMGRLNALLEAAKKEKIPVIGVHIGGESRRGELSDQFIERVLRESDVFIVWTSGNEDGFFTRVAAEHRIDLRPVKNRLEARSVLESLFAKK